MGLRTKIDLIFFFTTLIFLVLVIITYQNLNYIKKSSDLVNSTNRLIYSLESIESSVSKIEASSRGFIISGNENYLEKIESSKIELQNELEEIKNLPNVTHKPLIHIDLLEDLIYKKIKVSENGVFLRRSENIDKAIQFVSSGKGKKLMEDITEIINVIEKEEFDLLKNAIDENKVHAVHQNNLYIGLFLFIFSLIMFFHFHIRKNTFKVFNYKEQQTILINKLNHQYRVLDDFVNIISHNVRSPVKNITSLISILNDKEYSKDFDFILGKLNKVSQNLNETLNELLDVVQIKQDVNIERQSLQFKDVCDKVNDSLQGDILIKDVTIICDFSECPVIQYPLTYLESIFHNLISNAIKYSSPERIPKILISTHIKKGKTMLVISDNGLGLDLERIGDKLFGLRKIFHTTENAKGVGLFMTKAHIESLGGEITVESIVNIGTTFTVIFDKNLQESPPENNVNSFIEKQLI
ncbi:hypothetical protein BH23BAC1_BH23BAC1_51330 [soil metagenome]